MEYDCFTSEKVECLRHDGIPEETIRLLNEQERTGYDRRLKEMTFPTEATPTEELRLVLLGKAGVGKSSTGNLLLGEKRFKESPLSEECTLTVQEESTEVNGVTVHIIDTPCIDRLTHKEMNAHILKICEAFSEGIHGFLFVFSLGNPRMTEEATRVLTAFQLALNLDTNASVLDHCFCIFTNGNNPNLHTMLVEEKDSHLGKILNQINRRVVVVDNASRSEYFRRALRKRALGMVAAKVSRPHGQSYTNTLMQHEVKSEVTSELPPDERQYAAFYERAIWTELRAKSLQEMRDLTHEEKENIKAEVASKTNRRVTGQIHLAIEKILDAKIKRLQTANDIERKHGDTANGFGKIVCGSLVVAAVGSVVVAAILVKK